MRISKSILLLILVSPVLFSSLLSAETLHKAITSGKIEAVKEILKNGNDVNKADTDGETPLGYAVKSRNRKIVLLLIEKKADVNLKNYVGNTPLITAVAVNDIEIARVLINAGADPKLKNNIGASAKDFADNIRNRKMKRLLKFARSNREI